MRRVEDDAEVADGDGALMLPQQITDGFQLICLGQRGPEPGHPVLQRHRQLAVSTWRQLSVTDADGAVLPVTGREIGGGLERCGGNSGILREEDFGVGGEIGVGRGPGSGCILDALKTDGVLRRRSARDWDRRVAAVSGVCLESTEALIGEVLLCAGGLQLVFTQNELRVFDTDLLCQDRLLLRGRPKRKICYILFEGII